MDNENATKDFKESVLTAQMKFGIIAPVIQGLFPDATKTAYYKRVAENPIEMPNGKMVYFNYNTIEKWERAYRKNGFDGLCPKKRSDAGVSRKLPDSAISEIYRLKEKFPKANATLIYDKLVKDGFILKCEISLCTVQRFFRRNNLKKPLSVNTKDRKAFEEEFPCQMYQADSSYTVYITENGVSRRTYLIHVLDDCARLIVGARFFYEDNAYNFQKVLKEAIARFGVCRKLYVDSGSPYKNEQLSKICIAAGIVELHTPVRDGASKGKVERSFKTIKESWLYGFDPAEVSSLEELNSELRDYVNMRNNEYNRSIGCTPMERYRMHIDKIQFPESIEWLDEAFMNRIIRRVNNDSTISINNVSFDVPMHFIGDRVESVIC